MPLVMPDFHGTPEPTKESKVLTILLGAENKVYWYEGMAVEKMDSTTFDHAGLRQVILQKMKKVQDQWGLQSYQDIKSGAEKLGSHLNIVIKPGQNSRYNNLVDALDEMAICRVRYYCIIPINAAETQKTGLQ